MNIRATAIVLLLMLYCLDAQAAARSDRPNILLIVADDLGYADLGVYGGDIATPSIDRLAAEGVLFTQFHTAPLCSPTRAMLLSGNNNHVAGVASQQSRGVAGVALQGYEAALSDRIAPLPRLLRAAGYDTYTAGKWHLGTQSQQSPHAAGFARAFNLLQGGGSHFAATGFENSRSLVRENEELVAWPEGEYSTRVYTDKLIGFIEQDLDNGKPFFAFAAYTSPHWPLQVPDDYLDLYAGRYDEGYEALRQQRMKSLQAAGIVPRNAKLPPRNPNIPLWESLTAEQRRIEAREMELYAAMVDNLDDHVGRLLDYLKDRDLYDNTLIVLMADNGAAAEDFYAGIPFRRYQDYLHAHYDNSYELMGTASSFVSYGAAWAEAGSAPFKGHKGMMSQGGLVAPMIVSGPGVAASGSIDNSFVTVMDLAPTFLEIARGHYPDDGSVRPMLGESMSGLLAGRAEAVHDDDYVWVMSHRGQSMVRKGDWKLVTIKRPFAEADFALYNLASDPGETKDLRNAQPDKFDELLQLWRARRIEYGIVLPMDL